MSKLIDIGIMIDNPTEGLLISFSCKKCGWLGMIKIEEKNCPKCKDKS